jgi:protein SCO1
MIARNLSVLAICLVALTGCEDPANKAESDKPLPYLGYHDVDPATGDSLYYTVPAFVFLNQDSIEVSHRTYEGKIYVTDFFFTTCPTICPAMSAQMVRLQAKIEKENLSDRTWLLSHTVDPLHDTPSVLKDYAARIGANTSNWNFVTGIPEEIYRHANKGYLLTALPSDTAAGGFFHSDQVALIDRKRHIRGIYDGTSTKAVDQLFEDIKKLAVEK